jgi:hypothetical protein
MPPVAWRSVLAGSALSLALTLAASPLVGAIAGGALAGWLASVAPAYQGTLVAIATILGLAVLPMAGPEDTIVILVTDAALLAAGALAAVVASRLRRARR